ncbi:hypothetical protein [Lactiplantibacillus plajomi]|uniref:Uncharacterized protein n=1 Tax=Lactiplantibacillus plajomi TaxID=1457217 RepID=A0ABV6K1K3_9LACO|nr:hypothetical protein [Lactiplantibacillus plajomi]
MKRQIVPALPTERAQYERWYRLGLAAMTAVSARLRAEQRATGSETVSWFPQFVVRCSAVHADARITTVETVVHSLPVQPTAVRVAPNWVELTFELSQYADVPAWRASDGALWRLYDGLLTSLIGTAFEPLTQIRVGLTWYGDGQAGAREVMRPKFNLYDARQTRVTMVPNVQGPRLTVSPGGRWQRQTKIGAVVKKS